MKRLYPTKALHRVTEITPELLEAMGVRGLLLDVDDTLSSHGSQTPWPGAVEWAAEMTQKGFRLLILSNNTGKRVAPFAAQFGLPWLSRAAKPLPVGYLRGARRLGLPLCQCAAVGDQVFTDILGAGLCGMQSILLDPIDDNPERFPRRRRWEQPIRREIVARERTKARREGTKGGQE